jgi:hypothetical protein
MDNDSAEIRAAVQMAVVEVCAGGHHTTTRLTPQAIATVAELTIQFVRCSLVPNLQAFSAHAARRRITEQDVLLTVRNHREFHRKIQQKVEHFKRTRDILGAPDVAVNSRRNQAQPDQMADEDGPSSSNSSGSSTESESPEPAAKQLPATKRSGNRPRFDDLSSSDDDELNAMRAKLVRKKPKRAVPAVANPTTKAPKPAGPRRATFRLGGADAASTLDSPDSSSSPLLAATGTLQTQSRRLQEILLENQDEESLPSECD